MSPPNIKTPCLSPDTSTPLARAATAEQCLTSDVIHAVESVHKGTGPSAVMYIPAVPLTRGNAEYVRDQRESFLAKRPPPDFPGGLGESRFRGTGSDGDVAHLEGRNGYVAAIF